MKGTDWKTLSLGNHSHSDCKKLRITMEYKAMKNISPTRTQMTRTKKKKIMMDLLNEKTSQNYKNRLRA